MGKSAGLNIRRSQPGSFAEIKHRDSKSSWRQSFRTARQRRLKNLTQKGIAGPFGSAIAKVRKGAIPLKKSVFE
jgi:hypothetical protein